MPQKCQVALMQPPWSLRPKDAQWMGPSSLSSNAFLSELVRSQPYCLPAHGLLFVTGVLRCTLPSLKLMVLQLRKNDSPFKTQENVPRLGSWPSTLCCFDLSMRLSLLLDHELLRVATVLSPPLHPQHLLPWRSYLHRCSGWVY